MNSMLAKLLAKCLQDLGFKNDNVQMAVLRLNPVCSHGTMAL